MSACVLSHPLTDRQAFDALGYAGPFALSRVDHVDAVVGQWGKLRQRPRNRHTDTPEILSVFNDTALLDQLRRISDARFVLWRTNFFGKGLNARTMGEIGWHHDKHFQDGASDLDFTEIGAHLSVLIAMKDMTLENGAFEILPGSHRPMPGLQRDTRPFYLGPPKCHYVDMPAALETQRVQIALKRGEFVLFHSALVHRSLPFSAGLPRISMTGRLARTDIVIPEAVANDNPSVPLAM